MQDLNESFYGLPLIKIDGETFAVGLSTLKVQKAIIESIKDSIYQLETPFLLYFSSLTQEELEAFKKQMNSQAILNSFKMDFEEVASAYYRSKGDSSFFLGFYDGKELKLANFLCNLSFVKGQTEEAEKLYQWIKEKTFTDEEEIPFEHFKEVMLYRIC